MTEEEFLAHHGIKGMKWGVRRQRGSDGRVKQTRVSTERKAADKVIAKSKEHSKRSLTNKELADFNKRLELESKFNKYNPTTRQRGEAFVAGILATVGLGVAAYNVINSPAGKAAISMGKKKAATQLKLF